jgi:Tfp pilus assembly protein PilO
MTKKYIRILYTLAALVVINLIALLFFVLPNKSEISNWSTKIIRLQNSVHELSRENREVKAKLDGLIEAQKKIDYFREDVIGRRENKMKKIMANIDRLIDKFRLNRGRTTYSSTQNKDDLFEKVRIQFTVQGGYDGIRYFISDIESGGLFLILEKVSLNSSDSRENIQLNVILSTFFYKGIS